MTVTEIREFNRFYTNLIGALDYSRHLYTPYSLTEARVLYELAHSPGLDAADLRASLTVDAGQLSRLLLRFEQDGLVVRERSATDARRQYVTLTAAGREAAELLEERSRESVQALLDRVPDAERPRLAEALGTVRALFGDPDQAPAADPARSRTRGAGTDTPAPRVRLRAPGPGDLGWVVRRHGVLYAREYGWDARFEAMVARIAADFGADHDTAVERLWIAEVDGEPAGSVLCVRDSAPATARLRLLLVEPSARGLGVGERLVSECVAFARAAGYRELVLWTNGNLHAARRLYRRAGFTLTSESPHRSYGADLVGQDWHLIL
ncbi:helix-turn-helix domain-containing GNAT family N-acetyltransferase [Streptomyces sp. Z26]|uniref:bifunctional helix-turn-helix transcriptional regulator/GNAT family N-acetyltransferase n=1 Tax=Streptomyces sp. Z26 TaxID=2500177 RepID=UPI000EF148C6|nr:helix-turn-helix domain-containing GNAT family N-acetyltransferase [Streptomyces sp. Z26]RLL66936.1 MarR family transcriptional regulator [Streptomyces sp. Z26]